MDPPPAATILGAAARHVSNVVPRWASSRSRNWALVTLRIDSAASPAVPAQLTRMSMPPNSLTHVSIRASATSGSAGEPAYPTPEIRCAAASTAAESRPLTTTPAPWAASSSATANPMPRVPPTTTAPRPSRLIGLALLAELHGIQVPEPAQVRDQTGVVDLVGEGAAHCGREARWETWCAAPGYRRSRWESWTETSPRA